MDGKKRKELSEKDLEILHAILMEEISVITL